MPKITINGKEVNAKAGATILTAAYENGIEIPTLCFMKEINEIGYCRMCVVEVNTSKDLVSACDTPIKKGMVIETESARVVESRTSSLSLLANRHKFNCWTCTRGDGTCDFYDLLKDYHVGDDMFGESIGRFPQVIGGSAINLDEQKCVLCKRCVATCSHVVTVKALKFRDDDPTDPIVSPTPGLNFDESGCISCGECTLVCPTGALIENSHIDRVEKALRNPNAHVVALVDPAVRGAIGEGFDYEIGEDLDVMEQRMYHALDKLGFDEIHNLSDAADLLMVEQAEEFINRLERAKHGEDVFPMFTSSSAGWIRYIEQYQPSYLEKLAPLKSPHMIGASLVKEESTLDKEQFIVSISPSTSTKYEAERTEFAHHLDAVLTTKELARLIDKQRINFDRLPATKTAESYQGFGRMFGAIGVELLGTLTQVVKKQTGQELTGLNLAQITSFDKNIIEATIQVGSDKISVAVVHGGQGIQEMFANLASGKKHYHFVEVSDNFGGQLNSGGQPRVPEEYILGTPVAEMRNQSYIIQPELPENNPQVKAWYKTILQNPGSAAAHKFLHTKFSKKAFRRE